MYEIKAPSFGQKLKNCFVTIMLHVDETNNSVRGSETTNLHNYCRPILQTDG